MCKFRECFLNSFCTSFPLNGPGQFASQKKSTKIHTAASCFLRRAHYSGRQPLSSVYIKTSGLSKIEQYVMVVVSVLRAEMDERPGACVSFRKRLIEHREPVTQQYFLQLVLMCLGFSLISPLHKLPIEHTNDIRHWFWIAKKRHSKNIAGRSANSPLNHDPPRASKTHGTTECPAFIDWFA